MTVAGGTALLVAGMGGVTGVSARGALRAKVTSELAGRTAALR